MVFTCISLCFIKAVGTSEAFYETCALYTERGQAVKYFKRVKNIRPPPVE